MRQRRADLMWLGLGDDPLAGRVMRGRWFLSGWQPNFLGKRISGLKTACRGRCCRVGGNLKGPRRFGPWFPLASLLALAFVALTVAAGPVTRAARSRPSAQLFQPDEPQHAISRTLAHSHAGKRITDDHRGRHSTVRPTDQALMLLNASRRSAAAAPEKDH